MDSTFDIKELKRQFDLNGCVVIPRFLSEDELTEFRQRTERFLSEEPAAKDVETREKFAGTLKNLNHHDTWFDDQLRRGSHTKLVETLIDDDPEPATAAYFNRVPGEKSGIDPHRDSLGRLGATIWIALDEASQENGCLYYLRGSHREKPLKPVDRTNFDPVTSEAMAVVVHPGDAAIHDSRTVHWSHKNTSSSPRRAISFFYWAASSRPSPEDVARAKLRAYFNKQKTKAQ